METWQKLQKKLDRAFNRRKGNVNPALCFGSIFCIKCGKAFGLYYGAKRKRDGCRKYDYFCHGSKLTKEERMRGRKKCDMAKFHIEKKDERVWEEVANWIIWPKKYVEEYFRDLDKEAINRLEKKKAITERKIANKKEGIQIGITKLLDPDYANQELQIKEQIKKIEVEIAQLEEENASIISQLERMPSKEKIEALESTLSIGQMRYKMEEALKNFSLDQKKMVISWFFPEHERDELGQKYGVYVKPLRTVDILETDEIPKVKKKDLYKEIPGEFEVELRGLFDVDNALKLIKELRVAKGEGVKPDLYRNLISNIKHL